MTEHSCDALRIVNSQNTHRAFQEKHPNLYFPSLGIKIIYQSEEMVMVTNDEELISDEVAEEVREYVL